MAIVDELIAILGYEVTGDAELKQYNKSLDALEKKVENVGRRIGQAAAIAGAAVAAGFAFLGKGVLDTSAKFESYQATLETIEGSAEKAKASLGWVSQFAKTTPYEVDEVTQAFVKLRAYGMDPMDGTLTALGDTASGMGKNLMQAVEALADAATGEFERIKEFGVKAKVAGDDVTLSWVDNGKQMTKTVKKTGVEITKTLKEIWGKRFAGAMIRQSKTWNGMMSNLGDSWTAFLRKIGDAGVFEKVKDSLAGLMDTINTAFDDGTIDQIASSLSAAFGKVVGVFAAFAERLRFYIKLISDNWETAKPILKGIGIGLLVLAAYTMPVTAGFLLLAGAVDDFISYMTGGESIIGDFVKAIKELGKAFAETPSGASLVSLAQKLDAAFKSAAESAAKLIRAANAPYENTPDPNGSIWADLTDLDQKFKDAAKWVAEGMTAIDQAFKNAATGVADFISKFNGILELPGKIKAAFAGLGEWISQQLQFTMPALPAMPGVGGGMSSGGGVALTPEQIGANAGANFGRLAGKNANNFGPRAVNTTVNAPVNVNVAQPTQAPGAVGSAVSRAIGSAAKPSPSRIQMGPVQ